MTFALIRSVISMKSVVYHFVSRSISVWSTGTCLGSRDTLQRCCRRYAQRCLILFIAAAATLGCCPTNNCDYAFRPNWEGRHKAFTQNLKLFVGRPFNHQCLEEHACPPSSLESGFIRYTASDYRSWMKGCTFWFDVDAKSNIVQAVGYRGDDKQCADLNLQ